MRKKNTKRAIATYAMVSALVLSATGTPVKAAGQWEESNGAWKYTNEGKPMSGWQSIGGCWYAFDTDGSMKTGWVASDEKWYFMGQSGVMQESGWVSADGADYYLKGTGVMATDFIKDGYELDSTGKAVPMGQTKSVEFTENMDLSDKTIEGNLYIDAAKFKELELSGITVTGKVVILGNNIKDSKITIKDSTVNTISTQGRNAEIILSGKTTVDTIQMEENASVKPAEGYTGKVATIEIQSTAKNEVKVEVPAKTVTSNTFSPVSINAPIDNLSVNKKTDLKVNANVDNITVTKSATDTKVEVEKDATVGSIESDTKVDIGGAGKVEDVKGDDVTNETEKPSKPSTGGGSTGGGSTTPPVNPPVTPEPTGKAVSTSDELMFALRDESIKEIYLENDIRYYPNLVIDRQVSLNGNGYKISFNHYTDDYYKTQSAIIVKDVNDVIIKNLTVSVNKDSDVWTGAYGIQIYESDNTILENITCKGADRGILINGSTATLSGDIKLSDNKKGGIEVANGVGVTGAHLTINPGTKIENKSEIFDIPTLWLGAGTGAIITDSSGELFKGKTVVENSKNVTYYYTNKILAETAEATDYDSLKSAIDSQKKNIILQDSFALTNPIDLNYEGLELDGNKNTLTYAFTKNVSESSETIEPKYALQINKNNINLKNLTVNVTNHYSPENEKIWDNLYGIKVNNAKNVILNNIVSSGADVGVLVNGSEVEMKGSIDISGNEYGGIEVSIDKELAANSDIISELFLNNVDLEHANEAEDNPTAWTINELVVDPDNSNVNNRRAMITSNDVFWCSSINPTTVNGKVKMDYYKTLEVGVSESVSVKTEDELRKALNDRTVSEIVLTADINNIKSELNTINRNLKINGGGHTLSFSYLTESNTSDTSLLDFKGANSVTLENLKLSYTKPSNPETSENSVRHGVSYSGGMGINLENISIEGTSIGIWSEHNINISGINNIFGSVNDHLGVCIMLSEIAVLTIDKGTVIEKNSAINQKKIVAIYKTDDYKSRIIDNAGILVEKLTLGNHVNFHLKTESEYNTLLDNEPLLQPLIPATVVEQIETPTTEE